MQHAARAYALEPLEIASGYVFGGDPTTPKLNRRSRVAPLTAFEREVAAALRREPCGVAFSGGRDSSAVLAVATAVARREGLALPIPVTLRFPDSAESDESAWQETLVRELELDAWTRIEITDDLDAVGPIATAVLERHGLFWPANAHLLVPLVDAVQGGSLMTGDGGDLAFEPPHWASRPLAVLGRQVRPRLRDVLGIGLALSPAMVRRPVLRHREAQTLPCPWLRPDARRQVEGAWRSDVAHEPIRLDGKVDWGWRLRPVQMALETFDVIARDYDVSLVHPFNTPAFLSAIASSGKRFRYADRTTAMRELFGTVLPDEFSSRSTKAGFRDVFWNRHSSAFARSWDGEGADPALVDVDALRSIWQSTAAREYFRSCTQLQAAWLARAAQASTGKRLEQPIGDVGH